MRCMQHSLKFSTKTGHPEKAMAEPLYRHSDTPLTNRPLLDLLTHDILFSTRSHKRVTQAHLQIKGYRFNDVNNLQRTLFGSPDLLLCICISQDCSLCRSTSSHCFSRFWTSNPLQRIPPILTPIFYSSIYFQLIHMVSEQGF